MLPLRDTVRSYQFPIVNWTLIGLNVVVFLFELSMPPASLERFIQSFGVVAQRIPFNNPEQLITHPLPLLTLFTHMFLHAGWIHILSNLWILFIFGDNIEDRMGSFRYLVFYLLSGLVASITQIAVASNSTLPAIGASGAIAGVLGAYLLMFPTARVITLIPIFFIPWFVEIPAIFYLGFWFISQLFSGLTSLALPGGIEAGGVAWWAHIGGFVSGMLVHRLFIPRHGMARARSYPDEYWPW